MTEDEARRWIGERFGDDTVTRLAVLAAEVITENGHQNLIAPSTIDTIWVRHLLDSAQLVPLAPECGLWVDIGTGAGFPGLVAAILRPQPTLLVEPRRQRAAFLERCVALLGLGKVEVRVAKVEAVSLEAAVISARAVAPIEKILQAAAGCGTTSTRWLLPRGRSGTSELDGLRARWRGMFHMKQSLTDSESTILICDGPVRR